MLKLIRLKKSTKNIAISWVMRRLIYYGKAYFAQNLVKGTIIVDNFKLKYVIEGTGVPTLVIGSANTYPRTF